MKEVVFENEIVKEVEKIIEVDEEIDISTKVELEEVKLKYEFYTQENQRLRQEINKLRINLEQKTATKPEKDWSKEIRVLNQEIAT